MQMPTIRSLILTWIELCLFIFFISFYQLILFIIYFNPRDRFNALHIKSRGLQIFKVSAHSTTNTGK